MSPSTHKTLGRRQCEAGERRYGGVLRKICGEREGPLPSANRASSPVPDCRPLAGIAGGLRHSYWLLAL